MRRGRKNYQIQFWKFLEIEVMQREGKTEQTVDHEMMNITGKPVTFDQSTLDGEMKANEGVFSSKAVSRMKAS